MAQHTRHLEATGTQGQWVCDGCLWRSSASGVWWPADTEQEWLDHLRSVYRPIEGMYAKLADMLFDLGAIKFAGVGDAPAEGFKLKLHEEHPDARLSPIYLNLRTPDNPKPGPLTEEALELIGRLLYAMLHSVDVLDFTYVADIPNAGKPIADALMANLESWSRVQRIHLIKEEHDGRRKIAGVQEEGLAEGAGAVLIDDLITQADTKVEAIEALRASGLKAAAVLLVVDREQGGREQVEKAGCPVHSLFTLPELLVHYLVGKRIDTDMANDVMLYLQANSI